MLLPCSLDKCAQKKRNLISWKVFSQILVYLEGVRCTGEKRDPMHMYKVQCPCVNDICDEKYGACGHSGLSWLFLG